MEEEHNQAGQMTNNQDRKQRYSRQAIARGVSSRMLLLLPQLHRRIAYLHGGVDTQRSTTVPRYSGSTENGFRFSNSKLRGTRKYKVWISPLWPYRALLGPSRDMHASKGAFGGSGADN